MTSALRRRNLKVFLKAATIRFLVVLVPLALLKPMVSWSFFLQSPYSADPQFHQVALQFIVLNTAIVVSVALVLVGATEFAFVLMPALVVGQAGFRESALRGAVQGVFLTLVLANLDYIIGMYPILVAALLIYYLLGNAIVAWRRIYSGTECLAPPDHIPRDISRNRFYILVSLILLSWLVVLGLAFALPLGHSLYTQQWLLAVIGGVFGVSLGICLSELAYLKTGLLSRRGIVVGALSVGITMTVTYYLVPLVGNNVGLTWWLVLALVVSACYLVARPWVVGKSFVENNDKDTGIDIELGDERLLVLIVIMFGLSLVAGWLYEPLWGYVPLPDDDQPTFQWVWNLPDGYLAVPIPEGHLGFSLLGFFFPITVWVIYILYMRFRCGIGLTLGYSLVFLASLAIGLLFFYRTWTGNVNIDPLGRNLFFLLGLVDGLVSKWKKPSESITFHVSAMWFGMVVGDILLGGHGGVVGGFAWGLGDGLWYTALFCGIMMITGQAVKLLFAMMRTPGGQDG